MKKESNIWDTWFNGERVSDDFMMDREQGVLLPEDFKALEDDFSPSKPNQTRDKKTLKNSK